MDSSLLGKNETADTQTLRQLTEQPKTPSRSAHHSAELLASSELAVGIMRKTATFRPGLRPEGMAPSGQSG